MEPVYIIAEAGVNHNGSLETALKMVEVAAHAGASAIKFQTFNADKMVNKFAQKAIYQKETTNKDETQHDMLRKLELSRDDHVKLMHHAAINRIQFLSSPFDMESIDLLLSLGLKIFKVPSGEITNMPYLRRIGGMDKKIILSTGMSTLAEVEAALNILIEEGTQKENIIILHATTEYPAPFDEVNLKAMVTLKDKLGITTGYSDHTTGITIPIAAVALGASAVEKHFTLDRSMKGPDHKASLEPAELKEMIVAIRNTEKALGDGIKKPTPSEVPNIRVVRKSIHYVTDLRAGHVLTEGDLVMKRPGDGISPMIMDKLILRVLTRDVFADTKATWEDLL
jgi:N,N'-diacetyllegionaminate synthase